MSLGINFCKTMFILTIHLLTSVAGVNTTIYVPSRDTHWPQLHLLSISLSWLNKFRHRPQQKSTASTYSEIAQRLGASVALGGAAGERTRWIRFEVLPTRCQSLVLLPWWVSIPHVELCLTQVGHDHLWVLQPILCLWHQLAFLFLGPRPTPSLSCQPFQYLNNFLKSVWPVWQFKKWIWNIYLSTYLYIYLSI